MAITYKLTIVSSIHNSPLIRGVNNGFSSRIFPWPASLKRSSSISSSSSLSASTSTSSPVLLALSRRLLNLSVVAVVFLWDPVLGSSSKATSDDNALELQRYTDSKEGFTLLVPSSWIKVEKAGATLLFEESGKGFSKNNVGVVVAPARISKLGDFGSPQFVAEKLIQAEKRKESTKSAEVISVSERLGQDGLQVYEFEYTVDSTRGGMKRVFSAAFAASKKLYLLNISYADGLEKPLDLDKRMVLEKVLHSFDVASST